MNAYIVDDETGSRNILKYMLGQHCPDVIICGEADNVLTAKLEILKQDIDILFLDIKLGNAKTGFDVLDGLENFKGRIVFVTAFEEYALQAFRYNAIHYLLKPIDPLELVIAVNRVKQQARTELQPASADSTYQDMIPLPLNKGIEMFLADDIICMEGQGSYTRVSLVDNKNATLAKTLKYMMEKVKHYPQFIRVHRSYIVNRKHIASYVRSGELKLKDKRRIPVSETYKAAVAGLFT